MRAPRRPTADDEGPVVVAFRLRDPLRHTPAITAQDVREAVEAEIERLIELADAMDGDPDEEPWLADNGYCINDDREADDADNEDGGDDEPSLGWMPPGSDGIPPDWSYASTIGDDED